MYSEYMSYIRADVEYTACVQSDRHDVERKNNKEST